MCICAIVVFGIVMLKGTEMFAGYSVVLTMLAITWGGLTFWTVWCIICCIVVSLYTTCCAIYWYTVMLHAV